MKKPSEVLREGREEAFQDWWTNFSKEGFPTESNRRAFLAGFDRAIELAEAVE